MDEAERTEDPTKNTPGTQSKGKAKSPPVDKRKSKSKTTASPPL
jgi:hypothetical protein